ncbi:MAG: ATP-grasp enzyme [Pseudomonadota bacterium]
MGARSPLGLSPRSRSLAALALLNASAPLSVGLTGLARLREALSPAPQNRAHTRPAKQPRTVLISGLRMTKALILARAFAEAGHRVIGCESEDYPFSAHRFSRALNAFETLPRHDDPAYAESLFDLIERREVDVFVPVTSPAGSLIDSALIPRVPERCRVLHADPSVIARLDDKAAFAQAASEAGLRVPTTQRITSAREALDFDYAAHPRPFILKSIAYDPVGRLDLTRYPMDDRAEMERRITALPISEDNPYVLQEFIPGQEYCTHGFFREGQLRVHCVCRSSAFQVNYAANTRPDIREWVERFGRALNLTGQASFDFIEADDDGAIYAIECNPRTHSAITLFAGDDRLATAYLDDDPDLREDPPIEPRLDAAPSYWAAHQLWRVIDPKGKEGERPRHLADLLEGRDAVFDPRDPLPFLALHHVHIPALLMQALAKGEDWHRIDFNIGKLVKAGGD